MFRYFYWKTVFFGHVFLSKYLRWIKKTLEIICLFCVYLLICFLLIHCTGFRHLTVVLFALLWVFLLFHRLCSDVLSCVMFYVTELVLFLSLSLSVSDEQPSSKAVERATASSQSARKCLSSEEKAHLDHNANLWPSDRQENQLNEMKKEPEGCKLNELKYRETDGQNLEETCWRRDTQEVTSEEDNTGKTASCY